ncbi:MAG: M48 family metallopeptidase [Synergistaceae bacterium]|jgi:predicted metal-dependent hydrolase|nr:M48 family metallopeptidase [Synergistaceae bacterium]
MENSRNGDTFLRHPKFPWPFSVRRSPRARNVRLIVSAEGLTVVVPRKFCVGRELEPILESRRDWIEKAVAKVGARVRQIEETKGLPATIDLPALGEKWSVVVAPLARDRLVMEEGRIVLTSDFRESEALSALRHWLLFRGRLRLPPLLHSAAQHHSFQVANVAVREQKSRWGSCSSKGNISLNSRLLFLPPRLVSHVLLHELCHLREMNHSRAFHALLEHLDPEAKRHAQELKRAWSMVPGWALQARSR